MHKHTFYVLGLMSGTSLDGLDMCLAQFWQEGSTWKFAIKASETISYSAVWEDRLRQAHTLSIADIRQSLDSDYSLFLAETALDFIRQKDIKNIDFISSHGHTVLHQPEKQITLQIGNGPELHQKTGLPVVCNFRVQDVLLGGQGAPLVPIGDQLLFGEYAACVNLGGFANLSFAHDGVRVAYDICAVNIVLNELSQRLGFSFDSGGEIARSGQIDEDLLHTLNAIEFYKKPPPKSLGKEWVLQHIAPLMAGKNAENLLATYTEHVAHQLAQALVGVPLGDVILTGGGAYNAYLLERLTAKTEHILMLPSPEIIEQKEALIFAFLGLLRWLGLPNTLASVTGASIDHSAGAVFGR